MSYEFYSLPNRYVCSVLEEMRELLKAYDKYKLGNKHQDTHKDGVVNMLGTLVEEVQILVNRMEAALSDWGDIREVHNKLKAAKEELKNINKELESSKKKTKK